MTGADRAVAFLCRLVGEIDTEACLANAAVNARRESNLDKKCSSINNR